MTLSTPSTAQTARAWVNTVLAAENPAIARAQAVLAACEAVREGDRSWASVCALLDPAAAVHAAASAEGPFQGLPVLVKDIFDTATLPTRYGTPIYPHQPSQRDAAVVAMLRRAGAVVLGKAATTELAFLHPAPTRNPRAPDRTPGGSSAGSAAAVAAGLVSLAMGTQTGGSVIRPASYCGVVGYKPSFGWLPTEGLKCFSWSLDTVGLFTHDVTDATWCAQVLTGRVLEAGHPSDSSPKRVGVLTSYPWGPSSTSAQAALERGAALWAAQAVGQVELVPVDLPAEAAQAFDAHAAIQGFEAWRCLAAEWQDHRSALSSELHNYLIEASCVPPAAYEAALHTAASAREAMTAWMQHTARGLDALLLPSAPDEAPLGFASTGPSTFNRLWTLLGWPCLSVPGLTGLHGAPMGLQLTAPWGRDAQVLALGLALEAAIKEA